MPRASCFRACESFPVRLDLTIAAEREAAPRAVLAAFGHVDVLVNNAGYGLLGAVEEVEEDEIRRQLETNFLWTAGPGLIRTLLPHFRARGAGHILNISSEPGFVGRPGLGIDAASKFGLEGLSESLAQELDPLGVRVTIVESRVRSAPTGSERRSRAASG